MAVYLCTCKNFFLCSLLFVSMQQHLKIEIRIIRFLFYQYACTTLTVHVIMHLKFFFFFNKYDNNRNNSNLGYWQ